MYCLFPSNLFLFHCIIFKSLIILYVLCLKAQGPVACTNFHISSLQWKTFSILSTCSFLISASCQIQLVKSIFLFTSLSKQGNLCVLFTYALPSVTLNPSVTIGFIQREPLKTQMLGFIQQPDFSRPPSQRSYQSALLEYHKTITKRNIF